MSTLLIDCISSSGFNFRAGHERRGRTMFLEARETRSEGSLPSTFPKGDSIVFLGEFYEVQYQVEEGSDEGWSTLVVRLERTRPRSLVTELTRHLEALSLLGEMALTGLLFSISKRAESEKVLSQAGEVVSSIEEWAREDGGIQGIQHWKAEVSEWERSVDSLLVDLSDPIQQSVIQIVRLALSGWHPEHPEDFGLVRELIPGALETVMGKVP